MAGEILKMKLKNIKTKWLHNFIPYDKSQKTGVSLLIDSFDSIVEYQKMADDLFDYSEDSNDMNTFI
jgi:hypothetical protein